MILFCKNKIACVHYMMELCILLMCCIERESKLNVTKKSKVKSKAIPFNLLSTRIIVKGKIFLVWRSWPLTFLKLVGGGRKGFGVHTTLVA